MGSSGGILLCIFIPLVGAFLLPLVGNISPRIRNLLALLFVLISFVMAAITLPQAIIGIPLQYKHILPMGMSLGFIGDGLASFMAMSSAFICAIIIFYSFGYIDRHGNQNEYYMMIVLFLGSMLGLVFSANLIQIYIFGEIAAICCWRLMGFFREEAILKKADKTFFFLTGGGLLLLLGFIAVYSQTGSFDLTEIKGMELSNTAIILIVLGVLSKSAIIPLHTWLLNTDTSPAPVSALINGVILVNIGVYVFARLFVFTFPLNEVWHTVIPIIATISGLISGVCALFANDIKRILAYSTISQLSFVFLGLSSGSPMGQAGALIYILMHAFAQSGLFLCAGILEHTLNTRDIRQMGGLIKTMPITALAFLFCGFSIMGLPPFGGFFGKYMVILGSVAGSSPWVYLTFMLSAALTLLYLLRLFIKVFMGELKLSDKKEGTWEMVFGAGAFGLVSLLGGIFISIPSQIVAAIINILGW